MRRAFYNERLFPPMHKRSGRMTALQDCLLNDEQMRSFISKGYIKLHLPLEADFHAQVYADTEKVFAESGNPGDAIYDAVPLLQEVFAHPALTGALTSILGADYFMYPHRHCHLTPPRQPAQRDHKDSIPADHFVRHHRVRWAMAFYYPLAFGPTGVRPGTQYFLTPEAALRHDEAPMVGQAGDVVIVHYDVWHRGLANTLNCNRYMNKFLFCRASEPTAPSWRHESPRWWPPASWGFNHNALPIRESVWRWHLGQAAEPDAPRAGAEADRGRLRTELAGADEHAARNAAYALAASGEEGCAALFERWPEEAAQRLERNISGRYRNPCELLSTHGITAANELSVPRLEAALASDHWWIRASAADRLGDIGRPARGAIPRLAAALQDSSEWVRRNAAFSLGILDDEGTSARALGQCLTDSASRVAQNASLSLCKMASQAQDAADALSQAAHSDVKYVRAHAQLALRLMER